MQGSRSTLNIFVAFLCIVALMAILTYTPIKPSWGSYEMKTPNTISVNGEAKDDVRNQIATFTVGMQVIEADKETAMKKVTDEMNAVTDKIKALGIEDKDLKTTSVNAYQEDESYKTNGRIETEKGDWRAENTLTITLRKVDLANQVTSILNNSGANTVTGPNFSLDDTAEAEADLTIQAVANARSKAEKIAEANGQHIKGIMNLYEQDNNVYPVYKSAAMSATGMMNDAVATPELQSGSTSLTKTVSVTFEVE